MVAVTAEAGLPAPAAVAAPSIVDTGTLGGPFSSATSVNDSGQVVGQSETGSGQLHAFSWNPGGGMVDLGTLGGDNSQANAVNDSGQVVGYANLAVGFYHAFSWTASGGMSDLGTLGGHFSQALALNTAGEVVGWANTATGQDHAFLWTASGMVDLGTLGGTYSEATGVNGAGDIIGDSTTSAGSDHAFLWTAANGMVDLGTLGSTASSANDVSYPYEISQNGDITGYATTANGDTHGFFWSPESGMVDLGTLGGSQSFGQAVNDGGEVVGVSLDDNGNRQGFTWTAQGGMIELGDSIADGASSGGSTDPTVVNDAGQVVGWAMVGGDMHAFSSTPTGGLLDLGTLGGSYSSAVAENSTGAVAGYSGTPTGQRAVLWQPSDGDLALTGIPANVTADATGPSGAVVAFTMPGVTDDDQTPSVGCLPGSGATFAIGTTTVTCTASDSGDNPSTVSATFTVTVKGAAAQLSDLYQAVQGLGPGSSLATKVQQADSYWSGGNAGEACSVLAGFIHEVKAQSGKSITNSTADTLMTTAARIRSVMAC